MCDLMWRALIEKQPEVFNFIAWKEIDDVHDIKLSEMGKVRTDMEDFAVQIFPCIRIRGMCL